MGLQGLAGSGVSLTWADIRDFVAKGAPGLFLLVMMFAAGLAWQIVDNWKCTPGGVLLFISGCILGPFVFVGLLALLWPKQA